MTIERDYDLVLSVDAGYSGSKVTINGITFEIPNAIVNITNRDNFIGDMHKEGYLCVSYIEGLKHLVGQQARMLLQEPEYKEMQESKKNMMDSYNKFTTQDSEIHLMTCIARALIRYSEYTKAKKIKPELDLSKPLDENSPWNLYVILGYPDEVYKDVFRSVKPTVAKKHSFTVETDENTYNMNFTIKPENIMGYSQALAAYMGTVLDDEGQLMVDSERFKKLPLVVIDGGQKTVGIYKITPNLQVESAESNTDYAMNNVYERVVREINDKYERNDVEIYNIEDICRRSEGRLVVTNQETDNTEIIDIRPMVDKYQMEVCEELLQHLNKKFNKLLDIRQIVIAGGTGAAYYHTIMEYIKSRKGHLAQDIYLVDYNFMGRKIKPVNAISVGLYKVLKRGINEMKKAKAGEE